MFERGEGVTKIEQVQKRRRRSKFWSFCYNVIIDCALLKMLQISQEKNGPEFRS